MTREQAINYLRSSGMTEEQIDSVAAAFGPTMEDKVKKYCENDVNACKLVQIKEMIDTINDILKTNINDIADVLVEMNNLIYAILEVVYHD